VESLISMNNNSQVLEKIKSFLKEKIGMEKPEKAIFFENLEISGLDCYTLMEEFGEEFNVDMKPFDSSRYNMGDATINSIFDVRLKRKKKFGINHLADVVEKGIWCDVKD